MSTGQTQLIFNSRERALSVDVNRLQSFLAESAMLIRESIDESVVYPDFIGQGVGSNPGSLPVSVPKSTVYRGLLPVPQAGTFDFLVSDGVVGMYLPDAVPNPDDSPYKYVADPGITAAGILTVAANPGPSTRIDILECQPVETTIETDNRDIFDPSTGLFSPITVDKVREKRLAYRIRQGVSGNGFPGVVADWLPLCVISIPAAAPSLNTCTIWDVRPIVSGREDGVGKTFRLANAFDRSVLGIDTITAAPARILRGYSEVSNGSPWKSGGHLRYGTYTASSSYSSSFDVTDAANYEPGFAPVNKTLWYLYVCSQAFGLPRWAKYTTGAGGLPGNPEGIFIISNKSPDAFSGGVSNLQLPTQYGLGAAVQPGSCLLAGICYDPGSGLTLGMPVTSGKEHRVENSYSAGSYLDVPTANAVNNISRAYTLTPGITHPAHAKSVIVAFAVSMNAGAPGGVVPFENSFYSLDLTQTEIKYEWLNAPSVLKLSLLGTAGFTVYVKMPVFPNEGSVITHTFSIDVADATVISTAAYVRGWEF